MKKTIIWLVIILKIFNPALGQNAKNDLSKEDIQITVFLKYNENTPSFSAAYVFDKWGKITQIKSHLLNPVKNASGDYFAEFFYREDGKISHEEVYETKGTLLRKSQYEYQDNCYSVKVFSGDSDVLTGDIKVCESANETEANYYLDNVLGNQPSNSNLSKGISKYDKQGMLTEFKIIYPKFNNAINKSTFQYYKDKIVIEGSLEKDTFFDTFKSFRFLDKNGRLSKLSAEDSPKKWYTKFVYGKSGLLEKIVRRGRIHKTGEKIWSVLILQRKKGVKINTEAIEKINEEFINLYYPITGNMHYFNYFDSRRFISHQG